MRDSSICWILLQKFGRKLKIGPHKKPQNCLDGERTIFCGKFIGDNLKLFFFFEISEYFANKIFLHSELNFCHHPNFGTRVSSIKVVKKAQVLKKKEEIDPFYQHFDISLLIFFSIFSRILPCLFVIKFVVKKFKTNWK